MPESPQLMLWLMLGAVLLGLAAGFWLLVDGLRARRETRRLDRLVPRGGNRG